MPVPENFNWQDPQDRIAKNCCEALKQTVLLGGQFANFWLHRVHVIQINMKPVYNVR
jgi:hypothetical protein